MGGEVEHLLLALPAQIEVAIRDQQLVRRASAPRRRSARSDRRCTSRRSARTRPRRPPWPPSPPRSRSCRRSPAPPAASGRCAARHPPSRRRSDHRRPSCSRRTPARPPAAPARATPSGQRRSLQTSMPTIAALERRGAERGKAEIAILEIPLLQLLEPRPLARLDAARQMHLAILADHAAIRPDQDRAVEMLPLRRQLGIPHIEPDARARARGRTTAAPAGSACRARNSPTAPPRSAASAERTS